ncbi:hypothetical protein AFLA_000408 [Aspergillus flavus NRRL3357]|nr:hypothetical protein AFLA_000408 [Aspergillus flavus NRRL3357]
MVHRVGQQHGEIRPLSRVVGTPQPQPHARPQGKPNRRRYQIPGSRWRSLLDPTQGSCHRTGCGKAKPVGRGH